MTSRGWTAPFLAALMMLGGAAAPRAEIIDRVLAVLGDHIITLSDARAALRLGLVPPDVSADPIAAALQRLLDRRLMLVEVERYAPAEPPDAAVDAAVADVQARFADAAAFDAALRETSMSREDLRQFLRDTLRLEAYLQGRFASISEPSEQDLLTYYRDHPGEFTAGGELRPFEAVRAQVARRVREERRAALVSEWLEGLRRRASPVVLYLPGR